MRRPSSGQFCDSSLRKGRHFLGVVLAALFELFELAHVGIRFEMPSQTGQVAHRVFAAIEQLMGRPIGNMKNGPRKEIVALVVQDHEAFAALDIDRLFAVEMLGRNASPPGISARIIAAPAGGETRLPARSSTPP